MGTVWPFDAQAGPDTVPVPEKEGWPDEFRVPLIVTVKLPPTLKWSVTWLGELIVPVRERIPLSVLHVSPRKSTAISKTLESEEPLRSAWNTFPAGPLAVAVPVPEMFPLLSCVRIASTATG